jgi:hypothetical protein
MQPAYSEAPAPARALEHQYQHQRADQTSIIGRQYVCISQRQTKVYTSQKSRRQSFFCFFLFVLTISFCTGVGAFAFRGLRQFALFSVVTACPSSPSVEEGELEIIIDGIGGCMTIGSTAYVDGLWVG